MNKAKIDYAVDFLALVSFVVVTLSGLAMMIFLPEGVRQGRLQEFFGIQKGDWLKIHDWSAILLVVFVAIHLALHWDWVATMTKNILKRKNQ
jgi:thiosulfate reductase cytochrome b subunit